MGKKVVPVRVDEDWLVEHFDPKAVEAGAGGRAPFIVQLMEGFVAGKLVWKDEADGEPEWKKRARADGTLVAPEDIRAMGIRRATRPAGPDGLLGKPSPKGAPAPKRGKR